MATDTNADIYTDIGNYLQGGLAVPILFFLKTSCNLANICFNF